MIDYWLNRCRQANQALAFRVMLSCPDYEGTIPQWLPGEQGLTKLFDSEKGSIR
jgi:hypothetical protein